MCWDECLCLSRDRSKHALLGESLTVGAAAVFRLVEAGAPNLTAHVSIAPVPTSAIHCVPCVGGSIYKLLQFADEVQVAPADMAFAAAAGMVAHTSAAGQAARDIDRGVAAVESALSDLVVQPARLEAAVECHLC